MICDVICIESGKVPGEWSLRRSFYPESFEVEYIVSVNIGVDGLAMMNNGQSKWRIITLNSPGMGHANPSQRMAIFKTLLENPDDYIAEWRISEITQNILKWINAKMPMALSEEERVFYALKYGQDQSLATD